MTLKSDAKFEEKLTLGSINDMRNLVSFNASSGKSWNLHPDVLLLPIAHKVQLEKYRRIISHNWKMITEKRSKLWRKTDFLFERWHEEFWWTSTWAVGSLKICTFVENLHFCINFWAKKIQRSCVVKKDLWFQKWHN